MILDGALLDQQLHETVTDPRSYLLAFHPEIEASIPPLDYIMLTADPLIARVNSGVWIASCPCGAEGIPAPGGVVWFDMPLVWCIRCGNQGVGGGWRPITVPPEEERQRIEAVLLCRPNPADRNWEPSESVEVLMQQNLEHGDATPNQEAA